MTATLRTTIIQEPSNNSGGKGTGSSQGTGGNGYQGIMYIWEYT